MYQEVSEKEDGEIRVDKIEQREPNHKVFVKENIAYEIS